ncbi:MAG TPA: hypothetical protein PK694_06115, partial [Rhodospirillales bacterium]|nr:hypothetical protein [Rhodospirillales bacterium]
SGGLIGTLATRWVGRDRAKEIQSQIDKGGLLLWVRARDRAHEERAVAVLNRHSAGDVHVHDLPHRDEPENDPLSGFEPDPFLPRARV